MSSSDIAHMCREMQYLVGGHLKKAYMPHYEQIVLRMNPKNESQKDIIIIRGERVYLSTRDRPMPMTPPPFAMVLRKHLKNARLLALEQVGADRILKLTFDSKHGIRKLFVEMFQNGNILLVDEEEVILQALTSTSYADRILKKGHKYISPPAPIQPGDLTIEEFDTFIQDSDQPLGRTLGGKLNLGSTLSDTICAHSGFNSSKSIDDVDSSIVFASLQDVLSDVSNAKGAYMIVRQSIEKSIPNVMTMDFDSLTDSIMEISPIKLKQFEEHHHIHFDSFSEAIDAWIGQHDASAHQRREDEKMAQSFAGRGPSTAVERLERRLIQQERSLEQFNATIESHQLLGQMIQEQYEHVQSILDQTRLAIEKEGWATVAQSIKSIPWIHAVHPAEGTIELFLADDEGQPGENVLVDLNASVHQNAQAYFEKARKHKNKSQGAISALETTKLELQRAQKKEAKLQSSGKLQSMKRSKKFWFEHYKWAITSGGHLVIGGKDAKGNDAVVKKHCSKQDMYLHADLHGAPSCSLRSDHGIVVDPSPSIHIPSNIPSYRIADKLQDEMLNEQKLAQAAVMALAWSRAWASGGAHGTVYSVKPAQVSKTAQTGEYVGKGGFIVRGQRTWYKDLDIQLGIGMIAVNGVPLLATSTPELIATMCERYAIIRPGREKKEHVANLIYKSTGLSTDDILGVLPGAIEIIQDHGLIKQLKQSTGEEE
jgi:predicted ribosome quality control (RQC) complex YloA/Tae2 family protein